MTKQSNFIDFFDCAQVYLDFLSSSISGLRYIAAISDQENNLSSIAATLDYSVQQLKKLFYNYLNLSKGVNENEK